MERRPSTVHVAGKIRLVGLDEVKEALGARWAAVAARAMASAEHVIRRHCGPRDTWSRTADGGFLICFADATEEEAGVPRRGIGARHPHAPDRRRRDRRDGQRVRRSPRRWMCRMCRDDPADMLATVIGERLNGRLAQIEAQARETLRQAVLCNDAAGWSRCAAGAPGRSSLTSPGCRASWSCGSWRPIPRCPMNERAGLRLRSAGTRGRGRTGDHRNRHRRVVADHGQCGFRGVPRPAPHRTLCRRLPGTRQQAARAACSGAVRHAQGFPQEPRAGMRHAAAPVLPRRRLPVRRHGSTGGELSLLGAAIVVLQADGGRAERQGPRNSAS